MLFEKHWQDEALGLACDTSKASSERSILVFSSMDLEVIDAVDKYEDRVKLICESPGGSAHTVERALKQELEALASIFLPQAVFSFDFVDSKEVSLVRVQSDIKFEINYHECRILISHDSIRWGFNPFFYGRIGTLMLLMAGLMEYDENITASFVADPSDGLSPLTLWNGSQYDYPSLAYSSLRTDSCLVADPYFVRSHGYAELREASRSSLPSWSERSSVAVWRGSAHGHRLHRSGDTKVASEWAWHQRLQLCAASKQQDFAALLDVGIVNYGTLPAGDLHSRVEELGFRRAGILKADFARFKYVIDVDGFSNSWPGLFSALLSGSCVIKIESALGFSQWYYDRLVPWKNFVPVSADLEDLGSRLEWLGSHDQQAREIGAAGRRLALSMTLEAELHHSTVSISKWINRQRAAAKPHFKPGEAMPEVYRLAGAVPVEHAVITACYRKLLGREPDESGLANGIQSLRNMGLSQGIDAVIGSVMDCSEFLEKWSKLS